MLYCKKGVYSPAMAWKTKIDWCSIDRTERRAGRSQQSKRFTSGKARKLKLLQGGVRRRRGCEQPAEATERVDEDIRID